MVHEIRPICDHRETKRATTELMLSKDLYLVPVCRIFRRIFAFLCSLLFFFAGSQDSACLGQQIGATGQLSVQLFLNWDDN